MSKNDQINDNEMLRILEPMMHCICDKLCIMPRKSYDQEKLEEVCADCKVGQYSIDILNAYERAQSQAEKYSGIILCEECEYRTHVKGTDLHCCRRGDSLVGYMRPGADAAGVRRRTVKRMRLIDADELMEEINSLSVTVTGAGSEMKEVMKHCRESVMRVIEEQPTVTSIKRDGDAG